MTQEERLDYLIEKLGEQSAEYRRLPQNCFNGNKKDILRSIMNVRISKPLSREVLNIQDEYLQNEISEKGIVSLEDIPTIRKQYNSNNKYADKISIWQGDITRIKADAVVNAANSQMLGCFVPLHNCIDNCIHTYAGVQLREECNQYMNMQKKRFGINYKEPTGQAVLTKAYNLPAKYVIHTVGPIVSHTLTDKLKDDLKNCYTNILKCCEENNLKSIAFCCISTGVFCFPNDEASKIAVNTVTDFFENNKCNIERVIFNVFKDFDKECYEELLK